MVTTSEMGLNQVQEVNAQVANSGDFVRVTFDGRRLDVEGAEIYKFDWAQSLPARSVLYYTMQNPDTLVVRRNLQSNHVMQPSSAVKATEEANSLFEKVLGRKPIYLDVRPRIKSLPLNVLGAKFVTTVDQPEGINKISTEPPSVLQKANKYWLDTINDGDTELKEVGFHSLNQNTVAILSILHSNLGSELSPQQLWVQYQELAGKQEPFETFKQKLIEAVNEYKKLEGISSRVSFRVLDNKTGLFSWHAKKFPSMIINGKERGK